MADYKSAYLHLFNAVTDALRRIQADEAPRAVSILVCAQQDAEHLLVSEEETQREE